jgi:hypothetical protein
MSSLQNKREGPGEIDATIHSVSTSGALLLFQFEIEVNISDLSGLE